MLAASAVARSTLPAADIVMSFDFIITQEILRTDLRRTNQIGNYRPHCLHPNILRVAGANPRKPW